MKYKAGPAARRRPCFSLSINPLYGVRGSFTQGELEGAKPASNQIKCRAKPCLARRAWSEATIFVPQGGTKITTLFQAVEKSRRLFRQPEAGPAARRRPCLSSEKRPVTGSSRRTRSSSYSNDQYDLLFFQVHAGRFHRSKDEFADKYAVRPAE